MRILITGGTGFVGSHLLDFYLATQPDTELHSIKRRRANVDNVKHITNKVYWHDCDITDLHAVEYIIQKIKPDIIYHLAAQSFVPASWIYPVRTIEVNVIGSVNIFEAVRKFCPECIIQVASSSEIYGIPKILPITEENTIPEPVSPYGVSKLAMDRFAVQYHKSYGLKTVITRAFNHGGIRRGSEFVCSSFAKQIAEIEKGKRDIIHVGNLEASRDFLDIRDVITAYFLSISKCDYGTPYNIASGKIVTIQCLLDTMISFSKKDIKIKQDPERMRPSDLHTLQGDATKFMEKTGWRPQYCIERTWLDILNYWREIV